MLPEPQWIPDDELAVGLVVGEELKEVNGFELGEMVPVLLLIAECRKGCIGDVTSWINLTIWPNDKRFRSDCWAPISLLQDVDPARKYIDRD